MPPLRFAYAALALIAAAAMAGCGGDTGMGGREQAGRVVSPLAPCLDARNASFNRAMRTAFGAVAFDGGARHVKFVRDLDERCALAFPVDPADSRAGTWTLV